MGFSPSRNQKMFAQPLRDVRSGSGGVSRPSRDVRHHTFTQTCSKAGSRCCGDTALAVSFSGRKASFSEAPRAEAFLLMFYEPELVSCPSLHPRLASPICPRLKVSNCRLYECTCACGAGEAGGGWSVAHTEFGTH